MSRRIGTILSLLGAALTAASFTSTAAKAAPRSPGQQVAPTTQRPGTPVASAALPQRALLDRYCVTCHNERLKTAGLMLDQLDTGRVGDAALIWEKVVRRVRSESMPPTGVRRPDKAEYQSFTAWLETALDRAASANPNPGRPTLHRLNRFEYANAVRDLLGVEIDARSALPADDSGYGFDNIGDVLSVSPGLLERYIVAAGKIGRLAVGDPTIRPGVTTYRVPPLFAQTDRSSEDLPFGSRGGIAVHHQFPLDGEYVLKVRLQRTYTEIIRGMTEPHRLEVRIDRKQIKEFTVGGALADQSIDAARQQEYLRTADEDLEVRFPAKAGTVLIGATFVKEPKLEEGVFHPRPPVASFEYAGKSDTDAAVDSIQILGPYSAKAPDDSPSRRKIFVCYPTSADTEAPCAKKILGTLARRAYRRPVSDADVQTLLEFYGTGRRQGGFDAGIEWAIERILVAPDFVFRIEQTPAKAKPGVPYRISDIDLASRLSFFLWSSSPDDELLELAADGRLNTRGVLEQQVRRMLRDERSKALVSNFAGQWLYLRNIRGAAPDPNLFVDFDDNLREAFQREAELFLESQISEDRSVLDLLRADYTFVNERLARHYDIPNVYGSHFRRVTFSDGRRGGLLGQGGILTVTSYAHRTSPVVRGKWLLENLLGAPPPPPPANVPALRENDEGGKPTSVRERLEAHRKNPICASCHARMDPLGFALENFDAIGRWRDTSEAGTPIDSSGTLPDGTKFQGPAEFRQALLMRGDEVVAALTEKLLTYALGRGVEYYDMPAVRAVMRHAAPSDYRWSALLLGIVQSTPFQMKTAPELASGPAAGSGRRLQ